MSDNDLHCYFTKATYEDIHLTQPTYMNLRTGCALIILKFSELLLMLSCILLHRVMEFSKKAEGIHIAMTGKNNRENQ